MGKLLIVGCGDLGTAVGHKIAKLGHQVWGLRRNPPQGQGLLQSSLQNNGIAYIRGDITDPATFQTLDTTFDQVLLIVTPSDVTSATFKSATEEVGHDKPIHHSSSSPEAYRAIFQVGIDNILDYFTQKKSTAEFTFVSSTRVYGQRQGEFVTEDSPVHPVDSQGEILLAAEKRVLEQNINNTVVRFSGIYGQGRNYLVRLTERGGEIQHTPPYYTNRIHRDDCIGMLEFLLLKKLSGAPLDRPLDKIYLGSDDDPAPMWEVISWLAEQHGFPPPRKKVLTGDADQNKRCRNQRITALGYSFQYKSFRAGYSVK